MSSSCFYKCLLKSSIIIILLECTNLTQAVENWKDGDNFSTGRKLMGRDMNGGEFAIYIILVVVFSMISVCCRIYCQYACKDECANDGSSDSCEGCGGCEEDSLAQPRQATAATTNTWQPPVQQQPRQFTNFGTLSPQPSTLSFSNRTHFADAQNTATLFAQDSSSNQPPLGIANAPPLYNFANAPSAAQLYNAPRESHIYNIPSNPAPVNSVNADDPPPDYASVILGDLLRGNERTQYPSVIQEK